MNEVLNYALGDGSFWMPPQASSVASEVDSLYAFLLWTSAVCFIAIVGVTGYFVVKYRRRSDGQRTHPIAGHRRLEIAWSIIPAALLIVMFVWGVRVWVKQTVPPNGALEVRVNGVMWNWNYDYPQYGFTGVDQLVVPKDTPVKLVINAHDVIHSFFVPAFRLKRDAVPNRYNVAWFEAVELGEFPVYCAEYCGDAHSQMDSVVRVVTEEEFQEWLRTDHVFCPGPEGPLDYGQRLYESKGCRTCHSVDGSKLVGPTFRGLFGTTEKLADGTEVLVDENYVRESMMNPNAKVVQGYDAVMPTYKGKLRDEQINAIIDYIKSL